MLERKNQTHKHRAWKIKNLRARFRCPILNLTCPINHFGPFQLQRFMFFTKSVNFVEQRNITDTSIIHMKYFFKRITNTAYFRWWKRYKPLYYITVSWIFILCNGKWNLTYIPNKWKKSTKKVKKNNYQVLAWHVLVPS